MIRADVMKIKGRASRPVAMMDESVKMDMVIEVMMRQGHTLHPLLNSKPAGAIGLSVWPLR